MLGITLSALAVLFLSGLSLYVIWKERTTANVALLCTFLLLAAIEVSDLVLLGLSDDPLGVKRAGLLLESLLPAAFMFLSLSFYRKNPIKSLTPLWWALSSLTVLFPVSLGLFPLEEFFFSPDLQTEKILFLGNAGYWFYLGIMVFCVLALMNLEMVFSGTSGPDKWRMKFEFFGLASIIGVLIFYYSQGLLYRTINLDLVPVRSGVILLGTVMIGYSRFFRGGSARVAVSRYLFYRSLTLLFVGGYLIMLGLIGEGMSYFGVPFGEHVTVFFAFGAGVCMLLVLFSERLRRRARVFISKHFYAQKFDYREEWLKFTGQLTSCKTSADVQQTVLTTYRETFNVRGGALYLYSTEQGSFKLAARQSLPGALPFTGLSQGLAAYFLERGRIFDALDGEYSPDEEEALFVRQSGARLIVPLIPNGRIEGLLVLGEQVIRDEFTYEDYDLMKTLAKQAVQSIINFRLSEELAETREVAALGKVSSFVVHDLKNLASTLSLTLDNADEYMDEPDFQRDMLDAVRNTVAKMKTLMQKLKGIPEKRSLETQVADLRQLAEESLTELIRARKNPQVVCSGAPVTASVDGEEIKKVILNLVLNGLDATDEKGTVHVETGMNGTHAYIKVKDDGCGMSEEFVKTQLFKPFRTTKDKGLGIGLYQCRQIVEAHGGRIEVESRTGEGTVFTVLLPAARSEEV